MECGRGWAWIGFVPGEIQFVRNLIDRGDGWRRQKDGAGADRAGFWFLGIGGVVGFLIDGCGFVGMLDWLGL
jgi:hypothetical protein